MIQNLFVYDIYLFLFMKIKIEITPNMDPNRIF
jgi:hypothetical protein